MKILFVVFLAFLFVGCTNEDQPYYEITKVELKGANCFARITDQLDRFFSGESSQREVNQIWDCADRSLRSFEAYVEGDKANSYRAKDLRTFLEKYFLNDKESRKSGKVHKVSDVLLDEAMKVKRLFIGGNTERLTKAELRTTLGLIQEFRRITLNLLPHTRILFGEKNEVFPSHKYNEAEKAFKTAFLDLAEIVSRSNRQYDFESLTRLLEELSTYFQVDNPDTSMAKLAQYVPLIREARGVLIHGSRTAIESSEWLKTGELVGVVSGIYLRYRIYVNEKSLLDEDQFIAFGDFLKAIFEVITLALDQREDGIVPNAEVTLIFQELAKLDMLPLDLDVEQASQMWKRVVDFVLSPQNVYPQSGFTAEKVGYLAELAYNWGEVQFAMIRGDKLEGRPEFEDMKKVLATPWPLRLDADRRIIIDGDRTAPVDLESATRLNWSRVLFEALFDSYIKDSARREKRQLSREELRIAYVDLKPALVGLGLIEKTDMDFNLRLFRDANLFMPRSDGDEFLGLYEVVEYLHFVYAGIDAGSLFVEGLSGSCRPDDRHVVVSCFRKLLRQESKYLFAHLPLYLNYSDNLNDEKWQRDIRAIEIANRDEGASPLPIATSDVHETFIMLQYIETLFLRFDKNNSGDLDLKEVFSALDLFRNILSDIFGLDAVENADDIEAFFTYMMKYGEMPNPDDPVSELRYQNWVMSKEMWKLTANRGTILQILAAISARHK